MARARRDAVLAAAVTLAVLLGLVGCGSAGAGGPTSLAAAVAGAPPEASRVVEARTLGQAERARLAARLDALERRLLDGRARVQGWAELRERQQRVAAEAQDDGWRVRDMLRAREQERLLVRAIPAPRLASAWRARDAGAP